MFARISKAWGLDIILVPQFRKPSKEISRVLWQCLACMFSVKTRFTGVYHICHAMTVFKASAIKASVGLKWKINGLNGRVISRISTCLKLEFNING